jgi:hypothetical protein
MISIAVMCAQGAWPQNTEHAAAGKWKLKHSCNEVRLEQAALVIVPKTTHFLTSTDCKTISEAEREEKTYEQSHPETIPLSSITAIVKEEVTRRPVEQAIQDSSYAFDPEDMLKSFLVYPEAVIMLPLYPAVAVSVAGAMQPFRIVKTHRQSVRILWSEDGNPRSTNLSLSRGDVRSLLNHLEDATGKGWNTVRFDSKAQDPHASQVRVHTGCSCSRIRIPCVWSIFFQKIKKTSSQALQQRRHPSANNCPGK